MERFIPLSYLNVTDQTIASSVRLDSKKELTDFALNKARDQARLLLEKLKTSAQSGANIEDKDFEVVPMAPVELIDSISFEDAMLITIEESANLIFRQLETEPEFSTEERPVKKSLKRQTDVPIVYHGLYDPLVSQSCRIGEGSTLIDFEVLRQATRGIFKRLYLKEDLDLDNHVFKLKLLKRVPVKSLVGDVAGLRFVVQFSSKEKTPWTICQILGRAEVPPSDPIDITLVAMSTTTTTTAALQSEPTNPTEESPIGNLEDVDPMHRDLLRDLMQGERRGTQELLKMFEESLAQNKQLAKWNEELRTNYQEEGERNKQLAKWNEELRTNYQRLEKERESRSSNTVNILELQNNPEFLRFLEARDKVRDKTLLAQWQDVHDNEIALREEEWEEEKAELLLEIKRLKRLLHKQQLEIQQLKDHIHGGNQSPSNTNAISPILHDQETDEDKLQKENESLQAENRRLKALLRICERFRDEYPQDFPNLGDGFPTVAQYLNYLQRTLNRAPDFGLVFENETGFDLANFLWKIWANLGNLNVAAHTGTVEDLQESCLRVKDQFQRWLYNKIRKYEEKNGNLLPELKPFDDNALVTGPHECPLCGNVHQP